MIEFTAPMIDLILAGVALEFLALAYVLRRVGRAFLIMPMFLFLASGAALMAALRFSLEEGQRSLIAIPMLAALFLHATFLVIGFRRFGRARERQS